MGAKYWDMGSLNTNWYMIQLIRDMGSIPESGGSPGEGNGSPPQYSCLENSVDRGAWQATAHGVIKLDMTERTHTGIMSSETPWSKDKILAGSSGMWRKSLYPFSPRWSEVKNTFTASSVRWGSRWESGRKNDEQTLWNGIILAKICDSLPSLTTSRGFYLYICLLSLQWPKESQIQPPNSWAARTISTSTSISAVLALLALSLCLSYY